MNRLTVSSAAAEEVAGKEGQGNNLRKRKKRSRPLAISDLSDDLIGKVFAFLGQGNFLFIAGTSRRFSRVYETICENENDSTGIKVHSLPTRVFREYSWTATTMRNAVESISRLQWSRDNGCPWDWHTCANAARYGHLEVLQWARANGCPWNAYTCSPAAENGHLEVLQ